MSKARAILAFVVLGISVIGCFPSISIGPDRLPDGVVGQPYSATITVTSGDTIISISVVHGLPPGLTIQYTQFEKTALLSGTPTTAGSYTFLLSADGNKTNFGGPHGERVYTIVIAP